MEDVECARQQNRFRIMLRPEPKEVINLKRVILCIGALSQAISFIFGCYYFWFHLFEASTSAKCYVFEKLSDCHPIESGWNEFLVMAVDYVVFLLVPVVYLTTLFNTVKDHRNPPKTVFKCNYKHMYPALLPSMYYFLTFVFWYCSTLVRLKDDSLASLWTEALSSSLGLIGMLYVLITQMLSIQLCYNLRYETEAYIKIASIVRRMPDDVELPLAVAIG
ncbi:hypothetical protein L596_024730 [Steinernema carpocapsae]|uniref:Uncharacterized protein n=1 Tax=Steinernema carpocapsae TaxID=34508 RepID=A0A4U5M5L0_STECR|nr:hypothetical protein L596_024730 [Steinernema carpocapsae]